MSMQSRPASGASGHRSGVPNAMPGNSGGGGASAARRGSVALPALAVADGLRAKADLLERGLKNEELARNYMQLERVGAHARLRWPAASRPAWPSIDVAACDAHISCVCSHLIEPILPSKVLSQDKIKGFWDITKRELADARTELRLKDREFEEAEARGCWAWRRQPLPSPRMCRRSVCRLPIMYTASCRRRMSREAHLHPR